MRRALLVLALVAVATPAHADSSGVIKTHCKVSHLAQVDPIVAPGRKSEHLHAFYGNTSTDADSTYQSMVAADTTCNLEGDTAAYWIPTLHSKSGDVIESDGMTVYYRDWPEGTTAQTVTAWPPDFRMVAGYPDPSSGSSISSKRLAIAPNYGWQCDNTEPLTQSIPNCSGGKTFFVTAFPSCWDGVHTDSADHRSHVAYATPTGCPSDHPVKLPFLYVKVPYLMSSCSGCYLSSDGTDTGHADFWNTWDQSALERIVDSNLN